MALSDRRRGSMALPDCPRAGALALVTGGAGFLGAALVRTLTSAGLTVRVLDPKPPPAPVAGVDYRADSVLDAGALGPALDGVDYVFHLAANAQLWARDRTAFATVNVGGTKALLSACRGRALERVVVTSSEVVMKSRRGGRGPTHEGLELALSDMAGPYCASKLEAERLALAAEDEGLPVTVVNPTLPIGPGDFGVTPPTQMLTDYLDGRHPAFLEFTMNLADVRDLAAGHWLAALRGRIGARYLLGGEDVTMSELLAMLSELTGLPMPRTRIPWGVAYTAAAISEFLADRVTGRPPKATLTGVRLARSCGGTDLTRAREELGYAPRPAREALAEAAAWLAREGRLTRSFLRDPLTAPDAAS